MMSDKNQRSGPRCAAVPGQERSSPGLLLLLPPGPSLPLAPSLALSAEGCLIREDKRLTE